MNFDFDPNKNRINVEKHGIDFNEAQQIWDGDFVEFSALSEYENRFAILGPIKGKLFTCIYTLRNDKIRIISCRRSREKEELLYEKNYKKT